MKHIFIINPVAGKSDQSENLSKEIKNLFLKIKEPFEIIQTTYAGEAYDIAKKISESEEEIRFYACGGDGTLNEVVNGVYPNAKHSVAVYPIGTGNDFVKYFKDHDITLEKIVKAKAEYIDVLQVENKISLNIICAGFDACIANHVAKFKRLPFITGSGAYILSMIYCFFTSFSYRFAFKVNDEIIPESEYLFSIFANAKYYGGGFHPAPLADIQDGLLDFVTIRKVSRFKILKLINIYKKGEHLSYKDLVSYHKVKKVQILSENTISLNFDGEIINCKNPIISIKEKAIRFVIM